MAEADDIFALATQFERQVREGQAKNMAGVAAWVQEQEKKAVPEFNAATATYGQILDHAIEQLKERGDEIEELWDLIDKMIPYVEALRDTPLTGQITIDLLTEIEEKRKPHG